MKTIKVGKNYVAAGKTNGKEKSGYVKNEEFAGVQGQIGGFFALFAWLRPTQRTLDSLKDGGKKPDFVIFDDIHDAGSSQ